MVFRVLNRDFSIRILVFVLGEGALIFTVVLLLSTLLLDNTVPFGVSFPNVVGALIIVVVFLASFYFNDLYTLKFIDSYVGICQRLTKAVGLACIVLALIYYGIPFFPVGRGIYAISVICILSGLSWRYGYSYFLKRKVLTEKILVLGSGDLCCKILNEIRENIDVGYQVTGWVTNEVAPQQTTVPEFPLFKMNGSIYELAESLMSKKIVVALDQKRGNLPTTDLLRCKMKGLKILEGESFYEKLTGKILVDQVNPSWFIFSEGFRKSWSTLIIKRASGLVFSSLGLLLTSPIIGIIALAIKFDSKGPIIFKQLRCGEGERPFLLYKFRSMIENAEGESGPVWAQDDDQRVTRVGRILRKYRLDEIPQMWNVLKGDMNFVGPRPERPEFVEELKKIIPYYSERHTVKPGITGWAQVFYGYGASVEDALEKLKYDLFYIKNMNILIDLLIIFRTIKVVMNKNAVNQSDSKQQTMRVEARGMSMSDRPCLSDSLGQYDRIYQTTEPLN